LFEHTNNQFASSIHPSIHPSIPFPFFPPAEGVTEIDLSEAKMAFFKDWTYKRDNDSILSGSDTVVTVDVFKALVFVCFFVLLLRIAAYARVPPLWFFFSI
jgi:hypothetical protein